MKWLRRLAPARAYVCVSLRDGLAAVRVEPAATPGGRLRVTLAAHHRDVQAGARQLRAQGALRGAHQLLLLPGALRTFHSLPRPKVPDTELLEAVRWQVAASLDHPPDEALVQVLTLPDLSDNPQQQLLAVVAHGPTVRNHMAPLHAAGWAPDIIDIEETAQRNLFLLLGTQDAAGACVGFASDDALITLVAGGEVCLTRSITLDPEDPAAAVDRLCLQLQRALDGFERQTTRFAMRSLLLLPRARGDKLAAALALQLTQRLQRATLLDGFELEDGAALVLDNPTLFAHLLGAAAGRLQALATNSQRSHGNSPTTEADSLLDSAPPAEAAAAAAAAAANGMLQDLPYETDSQAPDAGTNETVQTDHAQRSAA